MANRLESGFEKTDSSNLPNVDEYMVWEYIQNSEKFVIKKSCFDHNLVNMT